MINAPASGLRALAQQVASRELCMLPIRALRARPGRRFWLAIRRNLDRH